MSVYSEEKPKNLNQCLQSLAQQTFKACEVILVEDGPVDSVLKEVIERHRNSLRIISVPLVKNVGLAQALNEGLKHCRHEFIARMDADDVALADRFEKQINLIQQGYDLVGGAILEVDQQNQPIAIRKPPLTEDEIRMQLPKRNPFNHMTVAFRADFVRECCGYPDVYLKEDYALWATMISNGARVANTSEILVRATAGREMYQRRGGLRYVKSEVALQRHFLNCGVSTLAKALLYGPLRSVVFLIPSRLRGWVYETFFRKRVQAQ